MPTLLLLGFLVAAPAAIDTAGQGDTLAVQLTTPARSTRRFSRNSESSASGTRCAATLWSSFSWRARASANYAFPPSATQPPPNPRFLFRGGSIFGKVEQRNHTAADEWTPWWDFTATNGTQACATYPNSLLDPKTQLVLSVEIYGIPLDFASNITLQIKPTGGRGSESEYEFTTRAAHLQIDMNWASKTWPAPPNNPSVTLPLMLGASTFSAAKVLVPEREANRRYWSMMPPPSKSDSGSGSVPQNISIVHGYHGKDDIDAWSEAMQGLQALGGNGVRGYPSKGLHAIVAKVKLPYTSIFGAALESFGPGFTGLPGWGTSAAEVQANLTRWAASILGPMRRAGFTGGLTQLALHDEPKWHLPANRNVSAAAAATRKETAGVFGFRAPYQYALQRYKSYLAANNVSLAQLTGDASTGWEGALPVSRVNLTQGNDGASRALRLRFYWGVRFYAWTISSFYAEATAALLAENKGWVSVYANWNNFHVSKTRDLVATCPHSSCSNLPTLPHSLIQQNSNSANRYHPLIHFRITCRGGCTRL